METKHKCVELFSKNFPNVANFPPGLYGVSRFVDGIHFIIINSDAPLKLQKEALKIERRRKPF